MAEETTPKTTQATDNSKPISAMPELTTAQGSTLVPVVDGGNKKVKLSTIKSYINEGMVAQQTGKSLSTNDYTDGEKAKLGALPTKAELETSLAGKQAAFTTSDELSMSEQNKLSLTDKAKMLLFIDQWNAACGTWGKYDPANAPDPQHPFYLNELWLTYEEAIKTYGQNGRDAIPYARAGAYINTRTNLPLTLASWGGALSDSEIEGLPAALFIGNPYIEVALISVSHEIVIRDLRSMFERCGNLRKVIDYLILRHSTRTDRAFMGCVKLETINLRNLACNISLADSPLLSLASLQYLVTNAANTSEITVTVHPNVYAKLSGDTTNAAAAALTADELAAWQAVMTSAASKNIAFATTE